MGEPNIILLGLAGSKAYGLDTPESDEDWRGVFVRPTSEILSLRPGPETIDDAQHETVLHEVGKFIRLAAAANPNILEQLYLADYRILDTDAVALLVNRDAFLSQRARQTYGGYAIAQVKKLNLRERQGYEGWGPALKKRREKHGRHIFRLLLQGQQLLRDGKLNVRLCDEDRERIFAAGKLSTEEIGKLFAAEMERMDAIDSCLPAEPDWERINRLLLQIRRRHW